MQTQNTDPKTLNPAPLLPTGATEGAREAIVGLGQGPVPGGCSHVQRIQPVHQPVASPGRAGRNLDRLQGHDGLRLLTRRS